MQWRSLGSLALLSVERGSPRTCAKRLMPETRTMLMSMSQQKAWMSVKWIWSATSFSSSSSVAKTQRTTLSGSLWKLINAFNLICNSGFFFSFCCKSELHFWLSKILTHSWVVQTRRLQLSDSFVVVQPLAAPRELHLLFPFLKEKIIVSFSLWNG